MGFKDQVHTWWTTVYLSTLWLSSTPSRLCLTTAVSVTNNHVPVFTLKLTSIDTSELKKGSIEKVRQKEYATHIYIEQRCFNKLEFLCFSYLCMLSKLSSQLTTAPKSVELKSALPLRGFSGNEQRTGMQSSFAWVQVPSA